MPGDPSQPPRSASPIRALELLLPSGTAVTALVWIEDAVIVMKELSTLARPERGLHRLPLGELAGVAVQAESGQSALLSLTTATGATRLRGSHGVLQGLTDELSAITGARAVTAQPAGRASVRHLIGRIFGL